MAGERGYNFRRVKRALVDKKKDRSGGGGEGEGPPTTSLNVDRAGRKEERFNTRAGEGVVC